MKVKLSFLIILFSFTCFSQEMNCVVQVNGAQIQSVNRQVFQTLRKQITEFINGTKWTNDIYAIEERIECTFMLTISEQYSSNEYKATLQIQSSRPSFNSSYKSPMLNIYDKEVRFKYIEHQPLEFNENLHLDNLTSILAFYVYMIIGLDYDSFELFSGEDYYQIAQKIVNNAQGDNYATGWKSYEGGRKNRYWFVENILNPSLRPIRESLYKFHRLGLDKMNEDVLDAKSKITDAVKLLKNANRNYPSSFYLKLFFDAKADEIVNIYSAQNTFGTSEIIGILNEVSPENSSKWQSINSNQ